MKPKITMDNKQQIAEPNLAGVSRRRFLQLSGGIAGASILAASCKKSPDDTVYIGAGDTALLNYLYIMEQIMGAFYKQAYLTSYYYLTASELQLFADLRDHQFAHMALLKKQLGTWAVPESIILHPGTTYADRNSTLNSAIQLEDMAVAAYNGIAKYFTDTNLIMMSIKMGAVQARHSAYLREILSHNTFSDATIVDSDGMDKTIAPAVLMKTLANYCQTKFDASKLPG
jgi:hypothetical protein